MHATSGRRSAKCFQARALGGFEQQGYNSSIIFMHALQENRYLILTHAKFASMLICTHLHALHQAAAHILTRLKFSGDSLKSQHAFQAAYTGSLH